ncbi:MAG: fatty acid desaturase [Alphaproteobacteria bacterium]|nr:MAG: fatty acid desaturase [Alphaproteobacteria bacterium]
MVTAGLSALGPWLGVLILAPVLTLHSSLQHEIIHGHPTDRQEVNDLLGFPALGLFVPYLRYRATHLAHHRDPILTDPHDDPESNFLDPAEWARLPGWYRRLLLANNTVLGRLVLGPALGLTRFYAQDLRAALRGDRQIVLAYLHHLAGCAPVLAWLVWWQAPLIPYLVACYLALSILRIRTFLEHRADPTPRARSVIVEDHGPLAWLFLFNNYHAVHHAHPQLPWYRLRRAFEAQRALVLRRNGGYRYASYGEVIGRYLLRRKDPVPHPLMRP